ncbi:MAG: YggS family pyridoxal phosphate-dependent enzyme [Chloroflexi bacterium]|nr:YggS family pyridoxal phosphate-dependent enzyme [Chloroflexota bacterium]
MCGNTAEPDAGAAGVDRRVREIERRVAAAAHRAGRAADEITVIGVTKTVDLTVIQRAFEAGMRHFGESRIQEAKEKITGLSALQPRSTWHMVGHLQTNKAKTAVEIFDVIHSVDSVRLAEAISQNARRVMPILIEVNVSGEASKYGFRPDEVGPATEQVARLHHLDVRGLMTVAPYTSRPEEVRPVFRKLRELRDALGLEHLSMGMTDDFEVAIEEGATMVRIGRAIFGERGD